MRVFIILFACFAFGCNRNERAKESQAYFKTEIDHRIAKINEFKLLDTLHFDPLEIDKEFDRLLLLSKDAENINACIHESKELLDRISVKFNVKRADLMDLHKGMTLEEIADAIKGNELNFFNQLLFKYKGADVVMYTAQ